MAENNFQTTFGALLQGLDGCLTSKTIVGEPIQLGDTFLLPLADVTLGVGAGTFLNADKKKNNAAGGLGAKISPCAILIVKENSTRMVTVKNQDAVSKIMDMLPDLISRFTKSGDHKDVSVDEFEEIVHEAEKKA